MKPFALKGMLRQLGGVTAGKKKDELIELIVEYEMDQDNPDYESHGMRPGRTFYTEEEKQQGFGGGGGDRKMSVVSQMTGTSSAELAAMSSAFGKKKKKRPACDAPEFDPDQGPSDLSASGGAGYGGDNDAASAGGGSRKMSIVSRMTGTSSAELSQMASSFGRRSTSNRGGATSDDPNAIQEDSEEDASSSDDSCDGYDDGSGERQLRGSNLGKIMVFVKGADDEMYPRMAHEHAALRARTEVHVEAFTREGLRTLVYGQRELSTKQYFKFRERLRVAKLQQYQRARSVEEVHDSVESELQCLGASALEDVLAEGVLETMVALGRANIRVWMVTGDAEHTAAAVATSSSMIARHRHKQPILALRGLTRAEVLKCLGGLVGQAKAAAAREHTYVLIVEGGTLSALLDTSKEGRLDAAGDKNPLFKPPPPAASWKEAWETLVMEAHAVLFCRASPQQKAAVVRLAQAQGCVTLAVGDGANDVAMLEAADVGVGVRGVDRDGHFNPQCMQAGRAADVAVGRFEFVANLCLVHGRNAYRRSVRTMLLLLLLLLLLSLLLFLLLLLTCSSPSSQAFIAQYSFYKALAFGVVQVLFNLFTKLSGQSLFSPFCVWAFNALFTLFPVMLYAFDHDYADVDLGAEHGGWTAAALLHPELYWGGQLRGQYDGATLAAWVMRALAHGSLVAFTCFLGLANETDSDGHPVPQSQLGYAVFMSLLAVVSLQIWLSAGSSRELIAWSLFGCFVTFVLTMMVYSGVEAAGAEYRMFYHAWGSVGFWLAWPLALVVATFPGLWLSVLQQQRERGEDVHRGGLGRLKEHEPSFEWADEDEEHGGSGGGGEQYVHGGAEYYQQQQEEEQYEEYGYADTYEHGGYEQQQQQQLYDVDAHINVKISEGVALELDKRPNISQDEAESRAAYAAAQAAKKEAKSEKKAEKAQAKAAKKEQQQEKRTERRAAEEEKKRRKRLKAGGGGAAGADEQQQHPEPERQVFAAPGDFELQPRPGAAERKMSVVSSMTGTSSAEFSAMSSAFGKTKRRESAEL